MSTNPKPLSAAQFWADFTAANIPLASSLYKAYMVKPRPDGLQLVSRAERERTYLITVPDMLSQAVFFTQLLWYLRGETCRRWKMATGPEQKALPAYCGVLDQLTKAFSEAFTASGSQFRLLLPASFDLNDTSALVDSREFELDPSVTEASQ